MKRLLAVVVVALSLPFISAASEFDWMVREFSRRSGIEQTHIPFFGLARFAVAVTHPAGTSSLKLAVFEHPNIGAKEFLRLADSITGSGWKPIIRVRSKSGDASNIYLQPDGKHFKLLIASMDGGEATFVELRLKPDSLMNFVDEHKHAHQAW